MDLPFLGFNATYFGLTFHVLGCVVEFFMHFGDSTDELKMAAFIFAVNFFFDH